MVTLEFSVRRATGLGTLLASHSFKLRRTAMQAYYEVLHKTGPPRSSREFPDPLDGGPQGTALEVVRHFRGQRIVLAGSYSTV